MNLHAGSTHARIHAASLTRSLSGGCSHARNAPQAAETACPMLLPGGVRNAQRQKRGCICMHACTCVPAPCAPEGPTLQSLRTAPASQGL